MNFVAPGPLVTLLVKSAWSNRDFLDYLKLSHRML